MRSFTKDFVINNNLSEIEPLARKIGELCSENGIPEDASYDVQLALEEAVSNTIKYGYGDRSPHTIRVRAGLVDEELFLELEDDARAFDPLSVPAPDLSVPAEQRPSGGLGLYLLRAVMDSVEYRRSGTRNILRMARSVTRL